MNTHSIWGKFAAVFLLCASFAFLTGCGGAGGSISSSGGSGDWYYHWNCNGDSECLATNPTGQSSGTLDEGPREQDCLDVMQFGQQFWGSAATYSCDQSPSGTTGGGSSSGSGSSGSGNVAVNSVSPTTVEPGQTLTISGSNFPTDTSQISVTIDNATMPIIAGTTTSLTVTVPYIPDFTGPVVVTVSGVQAPSPSSLALVNRWHSSALEAPSAWPLSSVPR